MKENKKTLVICDTDHIYLDRLVEFLLTKEDFPFQLWYFCSEVELQSHLNELKVHILLISEDLLKNISREQVDYLFVLSFEQDEVPKKHDAKSKDAAEDRVIRLFRFQSAQEIYRKICQHSEVLIPTKQIFRRNTACRVISLFSPGFEELQTKAALTIGQLLAKQKRVLYLNFDGCCSSFFLQTQQYYDLSDLVYFHTNSNDKFLNNFQMIKQTMNKMDYILPVRTYMDITGVSFERWYSILTTLIDSKMYDVILLDLFPQVQKVIELLMICDQIFYLSNDNTISQRKHKRFTEMLDFLEADELIQKLSPIPVRDGDIYPEFPEELPFSEYADYIQNYLNTIGEKRHEQIQSC